MLVGSEWSWVKVQGSSNMISAKLVNVARQQQMNDKKYGIHYQY